MTDKRTSADDLDEGRPKWTDPTTCPYEDCDERGGEIGIECHLSEEHGWCVIETHFESETYADQRDVDGGEQAALTGAGQ